MQQLLYVPVKNSKSQPDIVIHNTLTQEEDSILSKNLKDLPIWVLEKIVLLQEARMDFKWEQWYGNRLYRLIHNMNIRLSNAYHEVYSEVEKLIITADRVRMLQRLLLTRNDLYNVGCDGVLESDILENQHTLSMVCMNRMNEKFDEYTHNESILVNHLQQQIFSGDREGVLLNDRKPRFLAMFLCDNQQTPFMVGVNEHFLLGKRVFSFQSNLLETSLFQRMKPLVGNFPFFAQIIAEEEIPPHRGRITIASQQPQVTGQKRQRVTEMDQPQSKRQDTSEFGRTNVGKRRVSKRK